MTDLNSSAKSKDIDQEYERLISNASGVNPVFPHAAKEQMRAMIEQIVRTDGNLSKICSTNQKTAIKAGFAAEEWHTDTFNLDSILKNDGAQAYTDKYHEFIEAGFKINDTPDLVVMKDGVVTHQSQSKYIKDANGTYDQMRIVDEFGNIKYKDMDSLIGPSDQINDVKNISHRAKLKEDAKGNRPAVAEAAKMVEDKASPTLKSGDVESAPLTNNDAKSIAKDPHAKPKTDVENRFKTGSTVRKMQEAASGAAAMSAIVSGTVNIVTYTKMVREGRLDPSEAVIMIATETAASAADSAIKAAAATGTQSLIVRYGSQELIRKMAGQGVGALVRSNAVSVATVCAIDAIKDLVLFGAGKITADQLKERAGKNILNTSAASMGGTLGALACGGLASGAFAATALPIVGGLAGGLICSMAMDMAIENGIEAPYRELVSNAASLTDSARLLEEVSQQIFRGQVTFQGFLVADAEQDSRFNDRSAQSAELTENLRHSIDRL